MNLVKRRLRAVGDGGMEVIGPSPNGARARTVALDDAEWIARVAAKFLRSVPSPMNHLLRHPDDASMARDPASELSRGYVQSSRRPADPHVGACIG